jgi:IS5 family transposase
MRVRRRCPPVKADKLRALSGLQTLLERARRIRIQQRHDKHKLYALHAAQVQCISKGKARNPYELGVKVRLALTHKHALMVGARSWPGGDFLRLPGSDRVCGSLAAGDLGMATVSR